MSQVIRQLPDAVFDVVRRWAEREHLSPTDYLEQKLADAVKMDQAWEERVRRGKLVTRERFLEILAQAPDVPPVPGDEIPE